MLDRVLEEVEEQCREERIPISRDGGDPVGVMGWKSVSIVVDIRGGPERRGYPAFHIEIPKKEALTCNVILHY